ncbi:MAG: phosphoglucosamine mutase [Alphaproteobacteria bacterium GM7ARS4]|nr:phosphoglucosamine mutase [Alphaproteobacteria bacterium GM7ARS4]
MNTLFGTDGIRGIANSYPVEPSTILKVAMATAHCFMNGAHRHRVIIGKDTRLSGYMVEPALTAGFVSMGMDVFLVGPLPTPAVSMLTQSLRGDIGIMISASHNPYHDNGIKFFDSSGSKLSDDMQKKIADFVANEQMMDQLAPPTQLGRTTRLDGAMGRYIEYVKSTFDTSLSLESLKIVVDCANGATYKTAPTVLWELGADVIKIHDEPNGFNINDSCGAIDPHSLAQAVRTHKANLGIALDGDGDRVVLVDEQGGIFDGDDILALLAKDRYAGKTFINGHKPCVIGTVISNVGLVSFLDTLGVRFHRAQVGDRHVFQHIQKCDADFGGETSGHILFKEHGGIGDGLIAALQALAAMLRLKLKASQALTLVQKLPQMHDNVCVDTKQKAKTKDIEEDVAYWRKKLGQHGMLVVRPSGTEPVIRITASSQNEQTMKQAVRHIKQRLLEANS